MDRLVTGIPRTSLSPRLQVIRYFIDLKTLIKEGLLTKKECKAYDFGDQAECIDYEKIYNSRFKVLKKAYDRFCENGGESGEDYVTFVTEQAFWLDDYSLYMAVKDNNGGVSWSEWDAPLKNREEAALDAARDELAEEIGFYKFQQYEFDKQWKKLHAYANKQGIQIIGDIPIYVAFDSADTWSAPEMFRFNDALEPIDVAGCPPDGFSQTGQLWGNPLYDWEYHKKQGTTGGFAGSNTVSGCMMSCGSIISAVLMNIMLFRTEKKRQYTESGCRDRG